MAGTTTANSKKISHSNRAHDAEVEGRIFVAHSVKGSPRASIPNVVGAVESRGSVLNAKNLVRFGTVGVCGGPQVIELKGLGA